MAIAKVELPDGRIATIEIPDGMSMEEASAELQSMYDTSPEAFGAQPAEQSAPEEAPEEPGMLEQAEGLASKYLPPYAVSKGLLTGSADTAMGAYGAGVGESLKGMARGARQLFNKATGDDEELAELNQQEEAARADWEQRSAQHPIAGGAGKLVGAVGAPVAAAAALPAAGAGAVGGGLGLALRMGAGALSGGAGGASQPLTASEEAGGDRVSNAALGALVGGALPAATAGAGKLGSMLRRKAPEDALSDFAERQLGASHAKGSSAAYDDVTNKIDDQYKQLRDKFSQAYDAVEKAPTPPVKLSVSSRLGEEAMDLPEEVSNGLSPTARRVALSLQKGSTKTSPIVDAGGRPIRDARQVSFGDVRETIRELKGAKRALPYTDNGILQSKRLDAIIKNLDDDLDNWASSSPEADLTLKAAKKIDSDYAQQVAPFSSKDSPIGKFRRSTQDERNFDKNFLRPDAGQNTEDLLERVPGARDSVRELYGQKLLTPQGPTLKARNLEGGTLGEKVLSADERAYLKKVAESVRSSSGAATLSPTLERLMRTMGAGKIDQMLNGVEKYGQTQKKGSILADMLRSYGASQAIGE